MSQQLLVALAPAALELSLSAASGLQHEADQRDRDWQLRLERARFRTERTHRQYDAAEPENRLVSRELERRWEEALRAEQCLREEYARARSGSVRGLTDADRERVLALASDIPALWAIAGPADRKETLRYLIEGVEIEATEESEATAMTIRWVGGGVSLHELVRPVHSYERLGEFSRLVDRIRELLAAGQRSGLIAAQLNEEGFRSPGGNQQFTADRIRQVVCRFGLRERRSSVPADAPKLEHHEAWMTDLDGELGISIPTLMAWCQRGWVEARKVETTVLRWVVWADEEERSRLKKLSGGWANGLRHPYPTELTTPRRARNKKV